MNRYKDVLECAERLLLQSGQPRLWNGIAIDVRKIAQEFCRLDLAEIPDLNLGGPILAAFLPEFNALLVKANCIETRKRFSIAHELGHAQLEHSDGNAPHLFSHEELMMFFRCEDADVGADSHRTTERPLAEVLANKFAAYVLMPEDLVREAWRKYRDVDLCAKAMIVSRQALTIRLNDLGMV